VGTPFRSQESQIWTRMEYFPKVNLPTWSYAMDMDFWESTSKCFPKKQGKKKKNFFSTMTLPGFLSLKYHWHTWFIRTSRKTVFLPSLLVLDILHFLASIDGKNNWLIRCLWGSSRQHPLLGKKTVLQDLQSKSKITSIRSDYHSQHDHNDHLDKWLDPKAKKGKTKQFYVPLV